MPCFLDLIQWIFSCGEDENNSSSSKPLLYAPPSLKPFTSNQPRHWSSSSLASSKPSLYSLPSPKVSFPYASNAVSSCSTTHQTSIPSSTSSKYSSTSSFASSNTPLSSSKRSSSSNSTSTCNLSSTITQSHINQVKIQAYKDVDKIIKVPVVSDSPKAMPKTCSHSSSKISNAASKPASSNAPPIRLHRNLGSFVSSVPEKAKSPSNASQVATPKKVKQRYEIPKHLEDQIKKNLPPKVLKQPLSTSTYADYFGALLYAEDYYIEKWSKFILSDVTLELKRRELYEKISQENSKANERTLLKKKSFVAFEIENIPERRPFLLSRDFVFAKVSSHEAAEPFKGILYRVFKSTTVLVEFGDDFHSQHSSSNKYDVSFSFNRVCLKRAHQAVKAAKDSTFHNILFPNLDSDSNAIHLFRNYGHSLLSISNRIPKHKGPLPYLIEGPPSIKIPSIKLSTTGTVIQESISKIYMTSPNCHILICTPSNQSCDALMRSIDIPKEKLFRANAAFREYDLVPDDIITQSLYEEECFSCPSTDVLQNYSVITCTFVSSYRLRSAGLKAEHFSHIFLVDASSAMEPEVIVPLTNFVGENTVNVVTGSMGNSPGWVRSDIGRRYGLKKSYFQRLIEKEPYSSQNPVFIGHLK